MKFRTWLAVILVAFFGGVMMTAAGSVYRRSHEPQPTQSVDWTSILDQLAPVASTAYPECATEDSKVCVFHHELHGNGKGYSFLEWGDPEGAWSWQSPFTTFTSNPE